MEVYFFVYVVAYSTMFLDGPRTSYNTKRGLMLFVIIWLTLFFGLRWDLGPDWDQYYNIFKSVKWENFYKLNRYGEQNVEIGFAFVNILLKSIGNGSYTFYLIVTNALRFLAMAYASFKLSKYPIVTFFGLLSLQFFFPTRNPFATTIFYVALIYIVNKKAIKYLFTWLFACSIHVSSIIVGPLYWLYGIRLKFIYQLLIYFGSIILEKVLTGLIQQYAFLFALGSATFTEKLDTYSSAFREETSRSIIQYFLPLFFLIIFEYVRSKIKWKLSDLKKFDFFVVCYLLSLVIINVLQNTMVDLTRFNEFVNAWAFIIPFVLLYFKKQRLIIITIIFLYYLYRLNNQINYAFYRELFIPYRSIFGIF